MKKKLLIIVSILLIAFFWTSVQFAASFTESADATLNNTKETCLQKECTSTSTNEVSGVCTTKAREVYAKNICNGPIDIKICIPRSGGTWDCGVELDVKPGDTSYFHTCQPAATGSVKVFSRKAGSKIAFPYP